MVSLYQGRLNKLVFGYTNIIIKTPNDVSTCILAYAQTEDDLIVNEITCKMIPFMENSSRNWLNICTLQIYLDEFFSKVIDY